MDDRTPRRGRHRRQLVAAAAVGIVGAWLGMELLAHTTVPMGPFRVEIDAGFGKGDTRLGLPPFGALTADTHLAPLTLSATLEDVGVQELTDRVNRRGIDGLVDDVERDARSVVWVLAGRVLAVATLGGSVLGLLVFRARWRLVVAGAGAGLLAVVASGALAFLTFRPAAFTEPTYSGSLALAPRLIGPAREATDRYEDLRAGLERLVDGTVSAYTTLQFTPIEDDAIRVLHISDIHASPLGMGFAQEVARGFDVDLVIDTGDITSFATPIENLIVSEIPEFQVPFLFTRGSHDSIELQQEIARQSNGVVLDGRATTVDGLTVYGLGHPAFTPARGVPVDGDDFAELARSAGAVIAEDLEAIDPVDIVAVHDDRMAEAVAGQVPLVISGHFHETTATVVNGTLFLRIGTTGGSGAGIFRGLEDIPFSAEVLYFSRSESPELIAYDVIEQLPDPGSLTVTRFNVEQEFGELVLTPSPTVTGTPQTDTIAPSTPSP